MALSMIDSITLINDVRMGLNSLRAPTQLQELAVQLGTGGSPLTESVNDIVRHFDLAPHQVSSERTARMRTASQSLRFLVAGVLASRLDALPKGAR